MSPRILIRKVCRDVPKFVQVNSARTNHTQTLIDTFGRTWMAEVTTSVSPPAFENLG